MPDLSKWAVLYFTPRNLGDFKPRFKCHNSKHISKASAHTKGQSYSYQREHFLAHTHIQRYKEALVWETFVCLREGCIGVTEDSIRVQPRLWLVFQWSILNQQNQLHGRAYRSHPVLPVWIKKPSYTWEHSLFLLQIIVLHFGVLHLFVGLAFNVIIFLINFYCLHMDMKMNNDNNEILICF